MIKVTHIIGNLTYGGAEKLLLDICRKIDKKRFEINVIVLKKNNDLVEQFEDAGVKVKVFDKKGKFDFDVIERVADYLRQINPDIVHTHLFAGDFWGAMAAEKAGLKNIISTKHDVLDEGTVRNFLGRRARRKMKNVIAISDAIRDFLIKKEKIRLSKIKVIYNGIDIDKFYNKKPKIFRSQKLIIGSIGRLSKEKGHKHLIRACCFLQNKDWQLYLVGDGPMRNELEQIVKNLGLKDKVVFTGFINDVREYLDKMDVFVLPSVSEGLSLAVLEAAAAGKFVIATDVGGVPEIIKHKSTGLLFKPKSIEQLVRHLNWVQDNREEAGRMAAKLQQQVVEKFDINKSIKLYEDVYSRIMSHAS